MDSAGLDLRQLPAGVQSMRDARRGSSREVALAPFPISANPITAAHLADPADPATGTDPRPAHGVTWFAAIRWCNAASIAGGLDPVYRLDGRRVAWIVGADGFRLPTEAEWEYACRAGTSGPTYGPLADIAWTAADGVDGPQPVATKAPNAFGLHDTLGNVWEWCWDYADTARYGDYRSIRGGGWADEAWSCRASVRRGSAPDAVLDDVGFRVVRGARPDAVEEFQGWSAEADRARADIRGPLPLGWTPLRES